MTIHWFGLAGIVNQQLDMEVVAEAGDGEAAIVLYERHNPAVMILYLRMTGHGGLAVFERLLAAHPDARLLIMAIYDDDEDIFPLPDTRRQRLPSQRRTASGNSRRASRSQLESSLHLTIRHFQGAKARS